METIEQMQEEVKQLMEKYHLNANLENRYISLSSELGELGKEIVKGNRYGSKEFEETENFKLELGDVLFDYILLCNVAGVDIYQSYQSSLEKYEKRFLKQGTIGSNQ